MVEHSFEKIIWEITIPVLNEEKTLENNVLSSLEYIKNEVTANISIVIADNGSSDMTEKIGMQLSKTHHEIKYLKLSKKGVGLALRTSWLQSDADFVGYMDLDLATDLSHLKEVFKLLKMDTYQIINGSRLLKGSEVKNRNFVREITSRCFNRLVRLMLDVKLTDGMCGFKFFKRSTVVQLIDTGIVTEGWFFSTELLVKAIWSEIALKEIPIKWTDNKHSKVDIPRLSKQYLKELFRLKKEKKRFKKY
ncbi:MAG: glycosyltransferase [Saprospiraceae bacterium]